MTWVYVIVGLVIVVGIIWWLTARQKKDGAGESQTGSPGGGSLPPSEGPQS
jgi:hypothetical protein